MKITKEELKQIIQEELSELDEAFLDRLLGRDTSSPPMKLRNKISAAKEALKDVYVEAAKQKEDKVAKLAKELLAKMSTEMTTKLGSAFKQAGEFASYMEEETENE